jgi:hypothetical protein
MIYILLISVLLLIIIINSFIYFKKYSKTIHENLEMMEKNIIPDDMNLDQNSDNVSYSLPTINLNDYSGLNINLSSNNQKLINNELNKKLDYNKESNNLSKNSLDNNLDNIDNLDNGNSSKNFVEIIEDKNTLKKFKKSPLYGTLAWTNHPDFYIP